MTRTPIYFFSHGGPNIIEDTEHPAFAQLQKLGREITQEVRPKAIVVISAHWQGPNASTVEVNTAVHQPLIYDFFGFPSRYYKLQYPNTGSPELAKSILSKLETAGIRAKAVERGLDHGVFAPFYVAFNPENNPLSVPLVQLSLFDSENGEQHQKLGEAIASLREEGVLIICSGMAVHNLRDMWTALQTPGALPYAKSFDEALRKAVETPVESRRDAMEALFKRPDARKAHPTYEHLLPIYVGAGAAGSDSGKLVWTLPQGSMSWAMYRFGEVSAYSATCSFPNPYLAYTLGSIPLASRIMIGTYGLCFFIVG
ncbi:Extradiol aromatic ring-opening dioxygenase [Polychaeton citri CBS 116435]|uniref:Extradiol aromatic ring-opening dioxygenase n=1 Tax=Polychaeton citri CBS 116435 TaxID=1314669 RepID=A0A9P4Q7S4_9PEZI|nr:Extradiol aromatic ring-opening dioxygenase [Polychaeton citri CBS 116435]